MSTTERVTVTLPAELVEGIDRLERNRSRFIAEAVEHELARRRRQALLHSVNNPHPETADLADTGLGDWTADLPEDDGLVDVAGGTAVRWVEGQGLLSDSLSSPSCQLRVRPVALIDHLRSIDKRRIRRLFGQVSTSELACIDQGLELFLGLGAAQ